MNKKITAFCLAIIMLFSCVNFVWAKNEDTTNYFTNEMVADKTISDSSISISEADILSEENISLAANDNTDETTVNNVVLVLDKSGSMKGDKLETLKTAAKSFCESILSANSNSQIGIVTFSNSSSEMVYDFSSSLDTLYSNIDSISAGGSTYLAIALAEANKLLTSLTYNDDTVHYVNSVVIMSDGAVSDKTATTTVFDEMTNYYNIYSVYLGSSSSAKSFMESIQNSGFYYAENLDQLLENFGKIVNQILNPLNVTLSHTCTYDFVIKEYEITATINNPNINAVTNVNVTLNIPDAFELDTSVNPLTVTFDKISSTETTVTWKVSVAQEIDDCHYEISVDVTSDDLSTMTIKDQISVPGYYAGSKVLDFSTDTWSFENYSSGSYNIDSDVLNGFLMNFSNTDKQSIMNIVDSAVGGHCYGMSVTAFLAKCGELKPSEVMSGASTIHEISQADADQTITYYHLTQLVGNIATARTELISLSTIEALEDIANKARLVAYGGNPVVLGFDIKEKKVLWITTSTGGGHAVVCYDYARLADGEYVTFQGTDYNTCLYIYDSNFPNSEAVIFCNSSFDETSQKVVMNNDDYVYLADETGNGNWIMPYDINYFKYAITDADLLNTHDIQNMSNNYQSWVKVNTAVLYSNGINIKYGTYNNVIDSNGLQNRDGEKAFYDDSDSLEGSSYFNILMDNTESLELYYDDTLGDIDCSIKYDDFYCAADADSAGKAVLEPNGQASLEDVNSDYELAVTANDEYMVTPWYTVSVSGTSEATNPSLSICDDGYIFEGEELSNITVIANNDDETKELTFDSDETSVLITNEDDDLVVKEDEDGDGNYEKIISDSDGKIETTTNTEPSTETTTKARHIGGGSSTVKTTTTTEATTETTTEATTSIISKDVKVSIGSNTVVVGDNSYTMDAAPYIQASSNSTLVPLRFVAIAILGDDIENADDSSIIGWNAETKTASITANGNVIQFTANSNIMNINGNPVAMDNGVIAEITDGRMYIPFRALGNALGVDVEWDSDTKTAIYKTM